MQKIQRYPTLEILPAEQVCLHEHHDPKRTRPLMERIRDSRILYNPPLVLPFPGKTDKYMVLDGANRVTSMKEMGLPHLLVQIVDPNSMGVSLQTWNHVIWDIDPNQLFTEIESLREIALTEVNEISFSNKSLALFITPGKKYYSLNTGSSQTRSNVITDLVRMYSRIANYDRTMIENIQNLNGLYTKLAGLLIYPTFKISEVIQFADENNLLPAGITRFIVSPRALRVNYPLQKLSGPQSLKEKRASLKKFIQARMNKKGVRIYTETTVLYDE